MRINLVKMGQMRIQSHKWKALKTDIIQRFNNHKTKEYMTLMRACQYCHSFAQYGTNNWFKATEFPRLLQELKGQVPTKYLEPSKSHGNCTDVCCTPKRIEHEKQIKGIDVALQNQEAVIKNQKNTEIILRNQVIKEDHKKAEDLDEFTDLMYK